MNKIFVFISFFISVSCFAQVAGCTDVQATNYSSQATINDGSCTYSATTISPTQVLSLSDSIIETSGLIYCNNKLYTHNDNADLTIYELDTLSGLITNKVLLPNCINVDWEDISQDSLYFYVGDFGNNVHGNRINLQILRINKSSLFTSNPNIDTISFSYSNQTDFTQQAANQTNFDCEAFIVTKDSIFLFTKQWINSKTSLYGLSKLPGSHLAILKDSMDSQGLITGATLLKDKNVIALCGYTKFLQPFITLLYDYKSNFFFKANKRRLDLSLSFYQTEGICFKNKNTVYVSNEKYSNSFFSTDQKIHQFDLNSYLTNYYNPIQTGLYNQKENEFNDVLISPNPFNQSITIYSKSHHTINYSIHTILNQTISTGIINEFHLIDTAAFPRGCYFIKLIQGDFCKTIKIIKD